MNNQVDHCMTLAWDNDDEKKKVFIENLAPIVLFTYNRLDHTIQTVQALQDNIYAKDSNFYIYSDAPKNEDARPKVEEVQQYLRSIDGFKNITIIEREENWGLARNIIDGVTKIVNEYGKIIVLEDDIVTSKYFLKYMNDALEIYKNEEKVMTIASYFFPRNKETLPETFFLHTCSCWGWSTWKRSWKYFERNPQKLVKEFNEKEIIRFDEGIQSGPFWGQVLQNLEGKMYTWAVFWAASVFKQNGFTLYTREDLSKNIGMDGTGVHCDVNSPYNFQIVNKEINYFERIIQENHDAQDRMQRFLLEIFSPTTSRRIFNKLKQIVKFIFNK